MEQLIYIVHIITAFTMIALILLQQGKGSEAGASFGGGSASQTLFGSQGSGTFLSRLTAILAAVFFISSIGLGYFISHKSAPNLIQKVLYEEFQSGNTVNEPEPSKLEHHDKDIPNVSG